MSPFRQLPPNPDRRALLHTGARLSVFGLAALAGYPIGAEARRLLTLASAPMGSTGFHVINHVAAAVSQFTPYRAAALATAGSAENIGLLRTGGVDFAQTFSTNWIAEGPRLDAVRGRDKTFPIVFGDTLEPDGSEPVIMEAIDEDHILPDIPQPRFQQVFSYALWTCTPIVAADSKVESILDLEGHSVMPGPREGATAVLWRALLAAAGVHDKVTWKYGTWRDTYETFVAGEVHCVPALMVSGRVSALQRRLQQRQKMRIVSIPDDCMDFARAINPGVFDRNLPEDHGTGLEGPRRIAAFSSILAVRVGIEEAIAYDLVKAIFENTEVIHQWGGERLRSLGLETATRDLVPKYATHPGAARFFKEANVWRDGMRVGEVL